MRSDISCTLFISDPLDGDGGELTLEDSFGARPFAVAHVGRCRLMRVAPARAAAHLLLARVALHIAGGVFTSLRAGENLIAARVTGDKRAVAEPDLQ